MLNRRTLERTLLLFTFSGVMLLVYQVFDEQIGESVDNFDLKKKLELQVSKHYGDGYDVKKNGKGDIVKQYSYLDNITKYSKVDREKEHDNGDSVNVYRDENNLSQDIESKHGLQLAKAVRDACSSQHATPNISSLMHFIPDKDVLYCPVEKIATTFWRRVLYSFSIEDSRYESPFAIPEDTAHEEIKKHFSKKISSQLPTGSSFTFLFVRNPFSRILSAFIDKIVAPNPYYWRYFGSVAIRHYRRKSASESSFKGHGITFEEFVRLVTAMESSPKVHSDPHVKSIDNSCHTCSHNYSFIGRKETFKEDALYVLKRLDTQHDVIKSIEDRWKEMSVEASIKSNIESCFVSKKATLRYISWEKALQRLWLQLQMRGLIAKSQRLYLTKDIVETLTASDFIELAKKANKASSESELSRQKLAVKREAFASVGLSYLKKFTKVFRNDFDLFGYNVSPSYIFQSRDSPLTLQFFNYSHLN